MWEKRRKRREENGGSLPGTGLHRPALVVMLVVLVSLSRWRVSGSGGPAVEWQSGDSNSQRLREQRERERDHEPERVRERNWGCGKEEERVPGCQALGLASQRGVSEGTHHPSYFSAPRGLWFCGNPPPPASSDSFVSLFICPICLSLCLHYLTYFCKFPVNLGIWCGMFCDLYI